MVKAWYMDNSIQDQREEHHRDPPQYVTIEELKKTGVLYYQLNPHDYEKDLQKIRDERGYNYADQIIVNKEKLPNYEEKIKTFFHEHLHTDEEIRFILDGRGYFDIRDLTDNWIRILVEPGDLIILPAGIYHRFTVDQSDYIKVTRLFCGEPIWTPINRPAADENPARKTYVQATKAA